MRRILLAGAAALIAVVLDLRACAASGDADQPPTLQASAPAPVPGGDVPVGPTGSVNGVPVGWRRDDAGARAAAVSAVAVSGAIARAGFISRGDMIDALASERYAPVLAVESRDQLRELLGDLAAQGIAAASVVFHELALTARMVDVDDAAARDDVWSVLLVGVPNGQAPRQLWRTVRVELVWEHDDWRVDGWTETPGPTPALTATAEIATVPELVEVLAWPSAGVSS